MLSVKRFQQYGGVLELNQSETEFLFDPLQLFGQFAYGPNTKSNFVGDKFKHFKVISANQKN